VTPSLTRPGMLLGLGTLLVSLLAPSWTAAQPSTPPVRIGYLSGGSATSDRAWRQAFLDGLRELGWIPGQNAIVYERYADGKFEQLPKLAAELVRLDMHAIVTVTTPAAQAAKRTTTTVPIVVAAAGDVLGSGLVPSIAHPGGNITGLSFLGTELVLKQIDLLLGLIVAANVGNQEHRSVIIELAARHRIPAVYAWREGPEAGGLVSYGDNRPVRYRRAAAYVDRILKGARPGDLPVEQPTTFELVVNLRTAHALGLVLPPALLLRADDVIR